MRTKKESAHKALNDIDKYIQELKDDMWGEDSTLKVEMGLEDIKDYIKYLEDKKNA